MRAQFIVVAKNMRKTIFLLAVPLIIHAVMPHHETAFLAEQGSIDFLANYSSYNTDRFWNRKGKSLRAYDTLKSHEGQAYIEWAVLKRDSFFAEAAYVQVKESYTGETKKWRDSEAGWKHAWVEWEDSALSSELRVIIPMGDRKHPVRYGEWGAQASLLYSRLFSRGWVDSLLGYRYYNGAPSDQLRAMGALGINVASWLQAIGTVELEYGLSLHENHFDRHLIALNPTYRLLRLKGEIVLAPFSNYLAITAGYYRHVWGQRVGEGGGFYVGSWLYY